MSNPGVNSPAIPLRNTSQNRATVRPAQARTMPGPAFGQLLSQAQAARGQTGLGQTGLGMGPYAQAALQQAGLGQAGAGLPGFGQAGVGLPGFGLQDELPQPDLQMFAQRAAALSSKSAYGASAGVATPAAAGTGVLQVPGGFGQIIQQASQKYGVEPALIAAVMETESAFNPNARSPVGAQGLMQLMPGTAAGLGVRNASDPLQNVLGGAKLLGQLLEKYQGNKQLALAAYNAGGGAVDKYGGIPPYPETQRYVPKVMAAYERFKQQASPAGAGVVAQAARR